MEIIKTKWPDWQTQFAEDAIHLVAGKVASLSGDIRRALSVCTRALQMSTHDAANVVSVEQMRVAIENVFNTNKTATVRDLSVHEKLLLRAIKHEVSRTGTDVTLFHCLIDTYNSLCYMSDAHVMPVHSSLLSRMLLRLASVGIVVVSDASDDFYQKISLNVTDDELGEGLADVK